MSRRREVTKKSESQAQEVSEGKARRVDMRKNIILDTVNQHLFKRYII